MSVSAEQLESLKELHREEIHIAKRESRIAALEEARQVVRNYDPEQAYTELTRLMMEES